MSKLTVSQGTALSVGAVLGTGVISMPALAATAGGPASLLAWLALVLLSAPMAGTFAALGARHPDGGGVATYVRLAFGARTAAAVGWCFYFAVPIGSPVAAAFAGGYVADAFGGGRATMIGTFLGIIGIVCAMNWFGLRVSGRAQLALAGLLATLLLVTVCAALPHARLANLSPFAPHGWSGVTAAAAVLVWGFVGWEAVSPLSAEYRNPRRDVPRATAVAVTVVGVLYLAVAAASVLVLGPALATSPAPLADLLAVGVGGPVRIVTAVVAVLLTIGAVNAYLAGGSRLGVALARDGALPGWLAGSQRRSLSMLTGGSVLAMLLPLGLHTSMLLTTGCFTLVYVIGMAAALRLLPRGWARAGAGVSFAAVLALLWLTGWPALLSLVFAGGSLAYQAVRRRASGAGRLSTRATTASPDSIRSAVIAPNPNANPVCAVDG